MLCTKLFTRRRDTGNWSGASTQIHLAHSVQMKIGMHSKKQALLQILPVRWTTYISSYGIKTARPTREAAHPSFLGRRLAFLAATKF